MSGIERKITLDHRHIAKHLPNTVQSNRFLQRGRSDHVFTDEDTLMRVPSYHSGGNHTGLAKDYDRYGLMFTEQIGVKESVMSRKPYQERPQ